MKSFTIIMAAAILSFAFLATESRASWFIDAEKFHISAHGQTACIECHADIGDRHSHPTPADVNRKLSDFFTPDHCLECHDNIMDDLNDGVHGAEQVAEAGRYENCIQCHDPHDQLHSETDSEALKKNRCSACHDARARLPEPIDEDKSCTACHYPASFEDAQRVQKTAAFCFHCHESFPPRIQPSDYKASTHAGTDCLTCHPEADRFEHAKQKIGDCRQCHTPHDEKKAHDFHGTVACQACHLTDILPAADVESTSVLWEKIRPSAGFSKIHHMSRGDDKTFCGRCHFEGNPIGAAAMILPAKSIICMPCHTATFSVGDTTTIITLIVLFIGLFGALSVWLSGSLPGESAGSPFVKGAVLLRNTGRVIFSKRITVIGKTLFYDVLLQRRLYRRSEKRWFIHSLIFFPFVVRFVWGIIGLTTSLWAPDTGLPWILVNKNHPLTGFVFDVTGILILLGIFLALLRGQKQQPDQPPGMPGQDRLALGLIGGIVAVGFLLEGVRISMTGFPVDAGYAVFGYGVARLFSGMTGLTELYGFVWYVHAILSGAFLAYLPFSRLMHIIMAPVVLAMTAVGKDGHDDK
jgi:predicted CXXCH cytochrome family protein